MVILVSLCQIDDTEVINFLLSTEIIPLCLKTMEMGSELSKTVATFIVQKILIDQASSAIPAIRKLETGHQCETRQFRLPVLLHANGHKPVADTTQHKRVGVHPWVNASPHDG